MKKDRCPWPTTDIYIEYHDNEWGIALHNDRQLFEMLCLEGMQAGLSWITILKKRENFRKAFDNFDAEKIARYGDKKKAELMQDAGIIRNRLKIEAIVTNARAFLELQQKHGSFDSFIWGYVGGEPIINHFDSMKLVPPKTELSDRISKDLQKLGFKFAGSTIVYAYMQAVGIVNDHLTSCFLYGGNKNK